MKIVYTLALVLFTTLGLYAQKTISNAEAEKIVLGLQETYEQAVAKKDVTTILTMYQEDAEYLPMQHLILKGKDEIRTAWERTFRVELAKFDLELISVAVEGNLIFEVGRTHSIFNLPSGQQPGEFKYLNVWKRQADGSYKIFRAAYNQWMQPK